MICRKAKQAQDGKLSVCYQRIRMLIYRHPEGQYRTMGKIKKVLLNMDQELYEPMAESAKVGGLSITEYIRDAIKAKLKGPSPAREPNLLDDPPFDPTPTTAVQTPDTALLEWWTNRCKAYREMGGGDALAALLRDTGMVKPPAHVFQSIESLAAWLERGIGEPLDGRRDSA